MNDRDKFAAAALTGLLAGCVQYFGDEERQKFCDGVWALADAMLAARGATDAAPPASNVTLTDAEREAVDNAARWLVAIQSADDPRAGECAAPLRGLLARAAKEEGR
jgi:hypothetical protein